MKSEFINYEPHSIQAKLVDEGSVAAALRLIILLLVIVCASTVLRAQSPIAGTPVLTAHQPPKRVQGWSPVSSKERTKLMDDDVQRHTGDSSYWDGIVISEKKFSEAGFNWHLLRFSSIENPHTIIWVVPHDDENAAFEAMIAAIKKHGGTGIVVNSGKGGLRRQVGFGTCGGRPAIIKSCDPNRNFSAATPLFAAAILDHWIGHQQPVIALHTNGAGAAGDFSLLDIKAYKRGRVKLRQGAYRAINPLPQMDNYDTLGLIAYPAKDGKPAEAVIACRTALNNVGIHFWHEKVGKTDGSLSNYLALQRPEIPYFNAESREEIDLSISAARHGIMIDAYLAKCTASGNKPASRP